jgi:LAO/AO transport system kinase
MMVCEAAGYDIVIVETVGVGQSETAVANMTDMFVLLQLPNAGDDLQAIKKGVMELADMVVINKADIDPTAATRAQAQITSALRIFGFHGKAMHHMAEHGDDAHAKQAVTEMWTPAVIQISGLKGTGLENFWAQIEKYRGIQQRNGELAERRQRQALAWMWERVQAGLQHAFKQNPAVQRLMEESMQAVAGGTLAASVAARQLLAAHQSFFQEGASGAASAIPPVRAEPVEAPLNEMTALRQAQGDRTTQERDPHAGNP